MDKHKSDEIIKKTIYQLTNWETVDSDSPWLPITFATESFGNDWLPYSQLLKSNKVFDDTGLPTKAYIDIGFFTIATFTELDYVGNENKIRQITLISNTGRLFLDFLYHRCYLKYYHKD